MMRSPRGGSGILAGWHVRNSVPPTDGQTLVWDNTLKLWKPGGQQLTATATWNPANLAADGNATSTTITVTGAALGDLAVATLSSIGANDVLVSAFIQAADTVRVVLLNKTGGAIDIASGTLTARVWKVT